MKKRDRKIALLIASIIALVAVFQLVWPPFYPHLIALNKYPTQEYLQIMWFFSPIGLSVITIIIGIILIAWVKFAEP